MHKARTCCTFSHSMLFTEEIAGLAFANSTPEELRAPTTVTDLVVIEASQRTLRAQELAAARELWADRQVAPYCPGRARGDRRVYLTGTEAEFRAVQRIGLRPRRVRGHRG